MIKSSGAPATLAEKSSWTPKNYAPSNAKIYEERMSLIKKWYAAWTGPQRWGLLEFILLQLNDAQLNLLHTLLHPPPKPKPAVDFTRCLPRALCLRIFSYLDPQSLCRAAQVCWYWKYLAESNEIWQDKCLRLGWFLPTPPIHRDYTLWKRHYVECLCQLYWNPPQPPSADEEEDLPEEQVDSSLDTSNKRKKKTVARHNVPIGLRKPWRDPDPHPKDIHHCFASSESAMALYSRYPNLRSPGKANDSEVTDIPKRPVKPPPLPSSMQQQVPLPASILHPTLLEKMRLDSPSLAHMHLSTRNKQQTDNEISETFYKIQNTSPFPKLPPYFVHKSEQESSSDGGYFRQDAADGAPSAYQSTTLTGLGKIHRRVSTEDSEEGSDSRSASAKQSIQTSRNQNKDGLVRQAWVLPQDEDT